VIGIVCSGPLLRMMNVPNDGTFEMAKIYMVVIFAGIIGTVGYNINAGILQGLGDSHTSLLFLLIATIINIVLIFFSPSPSGGACSALHLRRLSRNSVLGFLASPLSTSTIRLLISMCSGSGLTAACSKRP
jgi:hypothetical protein